jgi:hypothetical protein
MVRGRFGVRSRKLSNVGQLVSCMGDQKFIISSTSVLSRWSRLHSQSLAPTHQPALGLRGGLWPDLLMCNA